MKSVQVKQLEGNISPEKITVSLNREEFIQYIRGEKKWVVRSVSSKYNEKNIVPKETIELKLRNTQVSISAEVEKVHIFDNFNQLLYHPNYIEILPQQSSAKNQLFVSFASKKIDVNHKIILFNIILELPDYYNKFIITGGPGFGKTTLLKELEKLGCNVFHEAARTIIEEQENSDDPILPWKDRVRFDCKVIKKMMLDYQQSKSSFYNFYDRGFPDLIGWRKYANLETNDVKKIAFIYPYERLVFFTKPWQEIYESNKHRPYSFKEASRINIILGNYYSNLGYIVEYLPNENIKTRVNFLFEKISEYRKKK